ncbi:3-oxoacyl-ACP synthase [Empedobacter stercoris]|uniref:3-oxoacyl-ACP synthase n=1 Tax=Empedobacter stercoris TaxID=1628248 RepID=A0ABX1WM60_9FLAO|nr:3-oxoacyl-ACP synthase [Empedobacter stercoris]MCA4808704.1 3-oxoacyl-ACP synthase [Empedobacter stercoris]NOJ75776.1 3-oxoacyl-ACP synthase [Empedobacter stercoris]QNT13714.1 3-oxoacyl-ACP synthase [Empedobacter stercoris]
MTKVEIKKEQVWLNDELYFEDSSGDFGLFSKNLFKSLEIDYPKFYKMDNQSKLAFLAAEIILKDENTLNENQEIALVFANRNSSLDSDLKHQKSIQSTDEIFPSPAVFVYTLANICLGEVSIRHHLKTENAFFISSNFDEDLLKKYANFLINKNKTKKVVLAWVDYLQEDYETKMYLID